jgi:hypothetical protein
MKRLAVLCVVVSAVAIVLAALAYTRSTPPVGRSDPVLTVTAVNGNHGVCAGKKCFVAFSSQTPVVGHRYYARQFWVPVAGGGRQHAVVLLPYPLPGPS